MTLFSKTDPVPTPDALSDELIAAKQAYETTKQSVISRAVDRRAAIADIQADLTTEDSKLQSVITAA